MLNKHGWYFKNNRKWKMEWKKTGNRWFMKLRLHNALNTAASKPANTIPGFSERPAVDNVSASRLCCYPPIAPLLPDRVSKSNIPQSVLQSLKQQLLSTSSPCHVVNAASPGQAGKELRVSTTFLENLLLRSLSTLQGHLFVTIKYLVKKIICNKKGFNVHGLKSYHVKTVTFRMLEETPAEQWQPENLVNLIRRSLQMLLDCVETIDTNSDGRIMNHFFLCDAAVYLKGADRSGAQEIARVLRDVMSHLPQLLMQFKDSLRPVSDSGRFYFHPFLTLPLMYFNPASKSSSLKYHEIYHVVRESLLHLSQGDCSPESQQTLTEMIGRLPDCARSAREALRALTCLKFGDRDAAVKVVSNCKEYNVSRGIAWSAERSVTEATEGFVWQHLMTCDSAWKFCFQFDQRPTLQFFPLCLALCFPHRMANDANYFYINFDALLQGLRIELTGSDVSTCDWIRDVGERNDADVQELTVSLRYSSAGEELPVEVLMRLLHKLP